MDDRTTPAKPTAKPVTRKKVASRAAPSRELTPAPPARSTLAPRTETDNWTSVPADERGDAIVAAMGLGGVDYMFFNSGSEIMFMQEAIAKANALGRPAPKLVMMTHEYPTLNAALGYAAVSGRHGGDRGARGRRHPALRLRHPHRAPFRSAGADHRRRAAGLLSGLDARRARRQPFLGSADARSERHRAPIHEVGSPARIPGQCRPDRQPGAADRTVRAAWPGLSKPAARDRISADRGRAFPHCATARDRARAGTRSRRHPRIGAAPGQGAQSGDRRAALRPQSGDRAGAGAARRVPRCAGRRGGRAQLSMLPDGPSALSEHHARPHEGRRRAGDRGRCAVDPGAAAAAARCLCGGRRHRPDQGPYRHLRVRRRHAAHRRHRDHARPVAGGGAEARRRGRPRALQGAAPPAGPTSRSRACARASGPRRHRRRHRRSRRSGCPIRSARRWTTTASCSTRR